MKKTTEKANWTIPKACELLGLNPSQLQKWLRLGYIKPAEPSPVKGLPNRFSYNDLVKLSILKLLGERRMLGTPGNEVAGYLVGGIHDISRYGDVLRIGPDPGGVSWSEKSDRSPAEDEPLAISINLALIRRQIDKKMK